MTSVHSNNLFTLRYFQVLPSCTLVSCWLLVPVLVHKILTEVVQDSEAVNSAPLFSYIDVNVRIALRVIYRNRLCTGRSLG